MQFFKFDNGNIRYTGRWANEGRFMTATNTGSYIELAFEGEMLLLKFDENTNKAPFPHLYIQIDGGVMQETPVDNYIRFLCCEGKHIARIILKSNIEGYSRFLLPLRAAVNFCGFYADDICELAPDDRRTVEFVGDSITEGILIDADYCKGSLPPYDIDMLTRVYTTDVTATYAWRVSEMLNIRPYICGFGAVGVTRAGMGRVPAAARSYPYNFEGSPVTYPPCDFAVLNHGANDRGHSAEEYLSCYGETLTLMRKRNPNAKIFALSAFCGSHREALREYIPRYNAENNDDVVFIDTTGWVPLEPLHPLRSGHKVIAEKLYEVLKPYTEEANK